MTTIIIGGSGMLYDATKWLVEKGNDDVILCSRNKERYQDLLTSDNVHFQYFDFQNPQCYDTLADYIAIAQTGDALTLLAWIHSPYYDLLSGFINRLNFTAIYLVRGSTSRMFDFDEDVTMIQLDKHPTENRWLTNDEISAMVIATIKNTA